MCAYSSQNKNELSWLYVIHDFVFMNMNIFYFSVYVFIGEHVALVDLVRALDAQKLLDSGDYIIISIDDKILKTGKTDSFFELRKLKIICNLKSSMYKILLVSVFEISSNYICHCYRIKLKDEHEIQMHSRYNKS